MDPVVSTPRLVPVDMQPRVVGALDDAQRYAQEAAVSLTDIIPHSRPTANMASRDAAAAAIERAQTAAELAGVHLAGTAPHGAITEGLGLLDTAEKATQVLLNEPSNVAEHWDSILGTGFTDATVLGVRDKLGQAGIRFEEARTGLGAAFEKGPAVAEAATGAAHVAAAPGQAAIAAAPKMGMGKAVLAIAGIAAATAGVIWLFNQKGLAG